MQRTTRHLLFIESLQVVYSEISKQPPTYTHTANQESVWRKMFSKRDPNFNFYPPSFYSFVECKKENAWHLQRLSEKNMKEIMRYVFTFMIKARPSWLNG